MTVSSVRHLSYSDYVLVWHSALNTWNKTVWHVFEEYVAQSNILEISFNCSSVFVMSANLIMALLMEQ